MDASLSIGSSTEATCNVLIVTATTLVAANTVFFVDFLFIVFFSSSGVFLQGRSCREIGRLVGRESFAFAGER